MTERALKVGVMLPTFRDSPDEALSIATEAEIEGLDGVFVYDHLWPMGRPDRPALAPFPMLGAIAARTERLSIGTLVARIGIVPDEILVAQFAGLHQLAPGRVIAGIGTGDHLSFNENRAYGIAVDPAEERRDTAGAVATALLELGLAVWIGGMARRTVAVAEEVGAVPNFWQASAGRVAEQAARTEVSWGGMARPGGDSADMNSAELAASLRPLADAGASWLVLGWPVVLGALAEAAGAVRAGRGEAR